jgi:hypothetical protein
MSIMSSQTTRLELIIAVAVLLVLLFCRQPPKSGNAGVRRDVGQMPQEGQQRMDDGGQRAVDGTGENPPSAIMSVPAPTKDRNSQSASPQPAVLGPQLDAISSGNPATEPTMPPQPRAKRIGVVDARKCNGLNYKDLMYGEVTVRWVWDGQKFVPRKVVEVKEKGGATSVWSFDERNGIVLSEIQQEAEGGK